MGSPMLRRSLLLASLAPALLCTAALAAPGRSAPAGGILLADTLRLPAASLAGQGDIDTGETGLGTDEADASDLLPRFSDMVEHVERDFEQGLVEFWAGAYVWPKPYVLAKGRSSQSDMRAAQAQGVLHSTFGVNIDEVNFKDDFGMDNEPEESYEYLQAEVGLRLENHCFRILWWSWSDNQDRGEFALLQDNTVFGDKVFYQGSPVRFPFRIMDTKLVYEYRIVPWHRCQVFFGLALHWIYTIDYNALFDAYPDKGYVHASAAVHNSDNPPQWSAGDAYFIDKPVDEDAQDGHYPLLSLSLRADVKPAAGFHLTFDIQEMWVYYGSYTDLRVGVWNDIALGVRVGAGYRLWALTADVEGVGSHETNFTGRAVFQGLWLGLFVHI